MIGTMLKGVIIFGTGVYTGVYIAQNYQAAVSLFCQKTTQECDKALDRKKCMYSKVEMIHAIQIISKEIEKVEDPKILYCKAKTFITNKLAEFNDGKKGKD